jgi:hypothetical protein
LIFTKMNGLKRAGLLAAFSALMLLGCHRSKPTSATPHGHTDLSYIDLQPGWRIKVVVPIIESGGYKVRTEEVRNSDGTVSLRTEKGFLGYETDYYRVNQRGNGKPFISFESAEFTGTNRQKARKPKPVLALFEFPVNSTHVRLLFLARVSENEHDAAVLASPSLATLDVLTPKVESNPSNNCTAQPEGLCSWIPEGIAVQPEKRDPQNSKTWVPAV